MFANKIEHFVMLYFQYTMSKSRKYDDTQVWRKYEITNIIENVKAKTNLQELSTTFRRSPGCIKEKLNSIAADCYFADTLLFKEIQSITGIKETEFLVRRPVPQKPCICHVSSELMPVSPPPEISEESVDVNICTSIAFNVLDIIIGSSIMLRSTIKELSTATALANRTQL